MRKVLILIMALVMASSLAYAAPSDTVSPLTSYASTVVTQKTTLITLTSDTLTGAPYTPVFTRDTAANCTNWRKGVVYVSLVGTSAGAVITPAYGLITSDVATGRYFYGTDRTVSSDSVFAVDLYGCNWFTVKVSEITGSTGTKCSVYIEPCTD